MDNSGCDLSEEQRRQRDAVEPLYRQRVEDADALQPGYSLQWDKLRSIMLNRGGLTVVAPQVPEDLIDPLIKEGVFFEPADWLFVEGQPSACHRNSIALWQCGQVIAIGSGYALSDGFWRQHSWGWKETGQIVETTEGRDLYFGLRFEGSGAEAFAAPYQTS